MPSPTPACDYALAAIDIDETLIGPDRKVGAANRRAIQRLQSLGCRVVLASGRRHANMLPYYAELGLDDYVVSCQGARVEHSTTGEVLYRAELPARPSAEIVAEGLRRGFSVLLWLNDRVFAQAPSTHVAALEKLTSDPVAIADLASLADRPAEKVVWCSDPATINATGPEMHRRLDGEILTTITEAWSLEFSALDANKRDGVAALARHLGIGREAVLAFGDGNNDELMLAWAGMGVAMPHGRPAAHAAARLVAPSGDPESALARGIEEVLRRSEGVLVA